jgi:hypothetical protein
VRPRSVDLRCAALVALAKREGAAASDVLASHLTGVPAAVRGYAIIGLAAVGDDRAWSQVHTMPGRQIDRPQPSFQPQWLMPGLRQFQVLVTVTYLVRHLAASPAVRIPKLVDTVRSRFVCLYTVEQEWLSSHRPGIAPGGPEPTQIDATDPARLMCGSRGFDEQDVRTAAARSSTERHARRRRSARAMHHQGRCGDLAEPLAPPRVSCDLRGAAVRWRACTAGPSSRWRGALRHSGPGSFPVVPVLVLVGFVLVARDVAGARRGRQPRRSSG